MDRNRKYDLHWLVCQFIWEPIRRFVRNPDEHESTLFVTKGEAVPQAKSDELQPAVVKPGN